MNDWTFNAVAPPAPPRPYLRLAQAARAVLIAAGLPDAVPGGAECAIVETQRGRFLWLAGSTAPGFVCAPYVDPELTGVMVSYESMRGTWADAAAALDAVFPVLRAAGWGVAPVRCWVTGSRTLIPWTATAHNPPWVLAWHTGLYRSFVAPPPPDALQSSESGADLTAY